VRRGLAWAGLIWCCFLVVWTSGGLGWVPFLAVGGLCAVYLIYAGRRAKRLQQTLPAAIERLAYRSDDTAVAFA
jgi:Flp pilus assembly protein TadB